MSVYSSQISWKRAETEPFTDNKYSRAHDWAFDGGQIVKASSSPHIVPLPFSDKTAVDPEEAFVASLSSCHMLFFLSFAANKGFCVDSYVDDATGLMEKNEDGVQAMTKIRLKPDIKFSGNKIPDKKDIENLHHKSHKVCFIANSVKTKIEIIS